MDQQRESDIDENFIDDRRENSISDINGTINYDEDLLEGDKKY